MSYLVLARKWRPQDFASITGQEHVTRTLTQAITQGRVHHAFLFCGARGVGKTTAARVLARALNCVEGPTPTPCGTCAACTEIASSSAVDVFEIDGASNRGIGEIRELREGIAYAPQRDGHKIYIIDEVHMLTTEAFNALLKTLEEPPPHVKFIFATTEPQKIPVTILSRCQRFDFKRIPLRVMVARIQEILVEEGVSIEERGLRLIARESEGSMRDCLSLLDRIISFCGEEASYEQVAQVLGAADRSWLAGITRAALERDVGRGLAIVQDVFQHGIDLRKFSQDLVQYLRDVTVLRVSEGREGLTDLSDEEGRELTALGQQRSVEDLQRLFRMMTQTAERLAHASAPRLELEMAVVRMCSLRPLVPIDALMARLAALERHLESGAPLPVDPGGTGEGSGSSGASSPPGGAGGPPDGGPVGASAGPASTAEGPEDGSLEPTPAPPEPTPVAPSPSAPEPERTPAPERTSATEPTPPAPEPERTPAPERTTAADPAPAVPTIEGDETPPDRVAPVRFDAEGWERLVVEIRADDATLAGTLDHGMLVSYADGELTLGFARGSYNGTTAQRQSKLITRQINARLGALRKVRIEEVDEVRDTPFERRRQRRDARRQERERSLREHPTVTAVITHLQGTLEGVTVYEEGRDER